jgi:hypothetical protein
MIWIKEKPRLNLKKTKDVLSHSFDLISFLLFLG